MEDPETRFTPQSPSKDGYLEFHYQKAPTYRSTHVDGFYGGTTPRRQLCISFFNERPAIPRLVRRPVISEGSDHVVAGPEEIVEGLSGVVRQVEMSVFMDLEATRDFYKWLGGHLRHLETVYDVPADERLTKP